MKDALAQLEASKSSNKDLLKDFNWINEESGWVIESVEVKYVDISIFSPLSGSTYSEFPHRWKNSMKVLINIKSNDNDVFLGIISDI